MFLQVLRFGKSHGTSWYRATALPMRGLSNHKEAKPLPKHKEITVSEHREIKPKSTLLQSLRIVARDAIQTVVTSSAYLELASRVKVRFQHISSFVKAPFQNVKAALGDFSRNAGKSNAEKFADKTSTVVRSAERIADKTSRRVVRSLHKISRESNLNLSATVKESTQNVNANVGVQGDRLVRALTLGCCGIAAVSSGFGIVLSLVLYQNLQTLQELKDTLQTSKNDVDLQLLQAQLAQLKAQHVELQEHLEAEVKVLRLQANMAGPEGRKLKTLATSLASPF